MLLIVTALPTVSSTEETNPSPITLRLFLGIMKYVNTTTEGHNIYEVLLFAFSIDNFDDSSFFAMRGDYILLDYHYWFIIIGPFVLGWNGGAYIYEP